MCWVWPLNRHIPAALPTHSLTSQLAQMLEEVQTR
jgi:hypothetical protein